MIDIDGIMYGASKIISPTSIEIAMQTKQAYKELSFSEMNIDIDPMILRVDFKDIDFLYYLYIKYSHKIQHELDQVFADDAASKKDSADDN